MVFGGQDLRLKLASSPTAKSVTPRPVWPRCLTGRSLGHREKTPRSGDSLGKIETGKPWGFSPWNLRGSSSDGFLSMFSQIYPIRELGIWGDNRDVSSGYNIMT